MRYLICDDDYLFACRLEEMLERYFSKREIATTHNIYTTEKDLLKNEEIRDVDVLFLDILLVNRNGIDIARELRRINPDFLLVFITGNPEFAPVGYEVAAFRYLLKDALENSIRPCLDAVVDELGLTRVYQEFDFVGGTRTVCLNDLVYIESYRHLLVFHFASVCQNNEKLYGEMERLGSLLDSDLFIRIHKSYIANVQHIEAVQNYKASMAEGSVLPISQGRFAEVKKMFFAYRGRI